MHLRRARARTGRGRVRGHLLRTNLLAEAWITPPEAREARRLVRTRAGLVRMRSLVQSQLHALLADLGVIPELTTLFGPAGTTGWPSCSCPPPAQSTGCRPAPDRRHHPSRSPMPIPTSAPGSFATAVRRLLPIPGIGLVTAATVVAAVWEVGRFPS